MAESSVDSYINAQPEQAVDFETYWQQHGTNNENSTSLGNKFTNFFFGNVDKVKSEYQAYLDNLNNRNEFLAMQSARAYDEAMANSQIQRLMADYEKAGLNPYLLLNNGSIGGGSVPTSAKAEYSNKSREEKKAEGKGKEIALIILALAKVASVLL